MRPIWSDSDAQKNRPPMLNSDSRPVNAAPIVATAVLPAASRPTNGTSGLPISAPPNISCSIGVAIAITPMPAETFMHSTTQISQNCGVLCASRRCTWPWVIMPAVRLRGGVQPSGLQPAGGTR